MCKYLEDWVDEVLPILDTKEFKDLSSTFFFRDPKRPQHIDNEIFFSPADGIILYQKFIKDPKDPIVEVKGINYTLQDVMGNKNYNKPSLVIGIFMTFLDPHINRIPYPGHLKYKALDCIESTNRPMLAVENDILDAVINPNNFTYLKSNERMLNTVYSPSLDYTYHMVQIADDYVNVIVPFTTKQNKHFNQNQRFSLIRYGSQCELVLPLDERFDFELLQEDTDHVESGLDPLVRIKYNK